MAGVDQIWREAARTLEQGEPFALATVVNVRGSTPREVGAKMLVRASGQLGTIGGGCGEAEIFRKASLVLRDHLGARIEEVDLTGDFDQDEVGTCGGIMDVLIERWSADSDLAVARELADASQGAEPIALLRLVALDDSGGEIQARRTVLRLNAPQNTGLPTPLPSETIAEIAHLAGEATPILLEYDARGHLKPARRLAPGPHQYLFIEPLAGVHRLVIVGAGHIAQPLARIAAMTGFSVTVIDDRAAFANRERFPEAQAVIARPFVDALESMRLGSDTYVVIVTRGHVHDEQALRCVLRQSPRYVGMIGSRRRVRNTLSRLEADGYPASRLDQVHAPIGLDIGAETPEEIAVSIMAEIIRVRRRGTADALSLGVQRGRLKLTPAPANA